MYVLVEAGVIGADPMSAHRLMMFAQEQRHAILFDVDAEVEAWLLTQSRELRDEYEFALEWSRDRWRLMPGGVEPVRVGANGWTPGEAVASLREPLRVWVEGPEGDRAFLEFMIPPSLRGEWRTALAAGHVRVEPGGGATLLTRVQALSANEARRSWAMFDSDGLAPGLVSTKQRTLDEACSRLSGRWMLERRMIENYLPKRALSLWERDRLQVQEPRRTDVFMSMRPEQRAHFNMKRGFVRDEGRDGGAPHADLATRGALYADLPDDTRSRIASGFGEQVAKMYIHEESRRWEPDDRAKRERSSHIQRLLALV